MTLIVILNKKHTCNVKFINVIVTVIISNVFISTVVVSKFVK